MTECLGGCRVVVCAGCAVHVGGTGWSGTLATWWMVWTLPGWCWGCGPRGRTFVVPPSDASLPSSFFGVKFNASKRVEGLGDSGGLCVGGVPS